MEGAINGTELRIQEWTKLLQLAMLPCFKF